MMSLLYFLLGLVPTALIAMWFYFRVRAKDKQEREAELNHQLQLLSSQLEGRSREYLDQRAQQLKETNSEQMNHLLSPIKQEMENVRRLMNDTRSANEKSNASLEGALRSMIEQTNRISQDANNLTDALKNRGKVHGDWGEQVLEDILQGSGLRPEIEYMCQASFKGANGSELRPDVVVRCADGQQVIVDSKVSLTAYADALGAENDMQREDAIRKNAESVKKHVRELVDKEYPKYVPNAMNYVLMFIPNEGAYVMALNYERSLAQEAFRRGVVIVNPTNLMLTLHLILQTWHQSRQEDNCKHILDAATGMYEKVVGLVDTCTTLGNQFDTAYNTYKKAMNQLSEGTGNLMHRVEGLKELGVSSTKTQKVKRQIKDDSVPIELPE